MAFSNALVKFKTLIRMLRDKLDYVDYAFIVILLLFTIGSLLITFKFVTSMKYLPSPLFGGDFYYQLGQIYYMYETSPLEWMKPSNGIGERPAYLPVYGALVTVFGKLFGLEPMAALKMFNIPLLLAVISVVLISLLLVSNKNYGLSLIGLFGFVPSLFLVFKYTSFTQYFMVPLLFLAAFVFDRKKDMITAFVFGVVLGLINLSHASTFVFSWLSTFFYLSYVLIKHGELNLKFTELKRLLLIVVSVGFVISLIYWYGPIFVYHFKSGLNSVEWSLPSYGGPHTLSTIVKIFKRLFSFSDIESSILSLIYVIGIIAFVVKRHSQHPVVVAFLIASVIQVFSFPITLAIIHTHFLPFYSLNLYLKFSLLLFSVYNISRMIEGKHRINIAVMAISAVVVILLLYNSYTSIPSLLNEYPYNLANSDVTSFPEWSLGQWVRNNTDVHDVILSTNEISFVVNALSGRPVVVSRRAQNDAFLRDFDKREMDAALIFYGSNDSLRVKLLKKYNVKYVVATSGWIPSDFIEISTQKITPFDPFMIKYNETVERVLHENGVKTINVVWWLDPSVSGPDVSKYYVLVVSPENYDTSGYGPWSDMLDKYLSIVTIQYLPNGAAFGVFKVNVGDE